MSKNKSLASLQQRKTSEKYIPSASSPKPTDYYHKLPSWRFSTAWRGDPAVEKVGFYGLQEIQKQGSCLIERLAGLDGKTWNEILIMAKKANHTISVADLSKEAQRILGKLETNLDEIVSLRCGARERLFGKIEEATGAFKVLFWDPDHTICPSTLKHT